MPNREHVISFVRQTLGCGCPEEVFQTIEHQTTHVFSVHGPIVERLVIGKRLLIYLWATDDPDEVRNKLRGFMDSGRKDRDDNGLNRFRGVIATRAVDAIRAVADLVITQPGSDDRIHLHVVHESEVP
jgi:hypothetical protein